MPPSAFSGRRPLSCRRPRSGNTPATRRDVVLHPRCRWDRCGAQNCAPYAAGATNCLASPICAPISNKYYSVARMWSKYAMGTTVWRPAGPKCVFYSREKSMFLICQISSFGAPGWQPINLKMLGFIRRGRFFCVWAAPLPSEVLYRFAHGSNAPKPLGATRLSTFHRIVQAHP